MLELWTLVDRRVVRSMLMMVMVMAMASLVRHRTPCRRLTVGRGTTSGTRRRRSSWKIKSKTKELVTDGFSSGHGHDSLC